MFCICIVVVKPLCVMTAISLESLTTVILHFQFHQGSLVES